MAKRTTWGSVKDVAAKEGVEVKPTLKVALVACGKSKLERAAPACELYTGNLFRAQLAHAVAKFGRDNVLILSAEHGLVALDDVLEPYDTTMAGAGLRQRLVWAERVVGQLLHRFLDACVDLHVFAGSAYIAPLMDYRAGWVGRWNLIDELKGLQVGERLAWFKARREESAPVAAPAAQPAAPARPALVLVPTPGPRATQLELLEYRAPEKKRARRAPLCTRKCAGQRCREDRGHKGYHHACGTRNAEGCASPECVNYHPAARDGGMSWSHKYDYKKGAWV